MIKAFARVAAAALTIGLLPAATSHPANAQATAGERCAALKMRMAARNARAQLDCAARGTVNVSFDMEACIERAAVALRNAFAKVEAAAIKAGGTCGTTGDADALELDAAAFCALIVSKLPTQ